MDHTSWIERFRQNEHRSPWVGANEPPGPAHLREPLIVALRAFQQGETGEGRVIAQAGRHHGAELESIVRLYIAEEGRHARELGLMLRALGAPAQPKVALAGAFAAARSLAGFSGKMAVLTAAEIVGGAVYGLLARHLPYPSIARGLRTIAEEESVHLEFQRHYAEIAPPGFRSLVTVGTYASALALWSTIAPLFAALQIPASALFAEVRTGLAHFHHGPAFDPKAGRHDPERREAATLLHRRSTVDAIL